MLEASLRTGCGKVEGGVREWTMLWVSAITGPGQWGSCGAEQQEVPVHYRWPLYKNRKLEVPGLFGLLGAGGKVGGVQLLFLLSVCGVCVGDAGCFETVIPLSSDP